MCPRPGLGTLEPGSSALPTGDLRRLEHRARRRRPPAALLEEGAPERWGPSCPLGPEGLAWPQQPPVSPGGLMAATCEISNVFSNYFSTMYSPEDPTLASVAPATTFGADDLVVSLSNPQMPLEGTGGPGGAGLGHWGRLLPAAEVRDCRGLRRAPPGARVTGRCARPLQRRPAGLGSSRSSGRKPRSWTGSATRWRGTRWTRVPSTSPGVTWTGPHSAAAPPRSCVWSLGPWGTSSTPSCGT